MRARRAVLILLFACCSLVAFGQEEGGYFSITSSKTWAPGQKPTINVWAQHVDQLEFRAYRVNDPVKFFTDLDDPHQFGGRAPKPPHTKTFLERFHDWKHNIFVFIRDFFRRQFTAENRSIIREARTSGEQQAKKNQTPAQIFAQVPLINSQQLVATWRESMSKGQEYWETVSVNVPVKEKGVYLIEATDGHLRAYTIVMVTQIAIVTKTAPGTILAFVADRQSGTPISNAQTYFFVSKKKVGEQASATNGLSQVSVNEPRPEDLMVMARTNDDFAVGSPWSYWMSTDAASSLIAYGYTDRPVYRPGDTVHYKLILRNRAGLAYQTPPGAEYTIDIQDQEGKIVSTSTAKSSAMGTLRGEYEIPGNAGLGDYSVMLRLPENSQGAASFIVEEYKKPEYEIRVIPEKNRVLQGQPIKATIEAKYYFGEPVAGAKVTWVVHQSRAWFWGFYGDEYDQDSEDQSDEAGDQQAEDNEYYSGDQTNEVTGTLDENGRLQINLPTSFDPDHHYDVNYRIEARVTDEGNREISGHNYVLATYGTFQMSARPAAYVYEVGNTGKIIVEARDHDNKPIATPFHLELLQWDWQSKSGTSLYTADGNTDATGRAEVDVPITRGGNLHVKITANTAENRTLETSTYLWVPDRDLGWWGGARENIQIIPDQKSYKPGQTAKLLIMSGPDPVSVLVTTEGTGLSNPQVITSKGGPITVQLPIKQEFAPNFFIGAAYLKDGTLHQGTKSINVSVDAYKLNVDIQSAKPQFQPGESASYTVTAKDATGKPVSAEFSFGVVDEAIYAIHPDVTTDILKFFYGRVFNKVSTDSSLNYNFTGEAGKKQMKLANVKRRNWLAQIKPERLVQPKIRKIFPDTAFWVADLKTGADGKASVKFAFPDSLTTWRATTRGITADNKVGSATEKVIVRKNVMVRLVVPRFFRQGDEVTISTIVHNYLPNAKTARVSMDVKGLDVLQGATRDVSVPSKGDVKVDWRVKAQKVSETVVTTKALTNEESDAMELTLPVIPYGVKISVPRSGSLIVTNGDTTQEIAFPPASDPAARTLQIDLSPSVAGSIFSALDYLTSYPYGCTEQTMSSFLPDIIVADAVKQLGLKPPLDPNELNKQIDAGIKRLYDYQHDDGGWGWWQTDESHVFMSSYVLAGLSQAKAAGYEIDAERLQKAQNWVRRTFDSDQKIVPDLRAYMAYSLVLSGVTDRQVVDSVWAQHDDLSPYGKAMLGLAMDQLAKATKNDDPRANELATAVEKGAIVEGDQAHWSLNRDPMLDFETDASPEATAFAAKFLARVRSESDLLPKAAFWLVTHRDEGYWWDSTKQTAFVVYGLVDFLKQSGELKPSFSVDVLVNDKPVLTKKFSEAEAMTPMSTQAFLKPEQLTQNNKVVIRKHGQGRLYWSLRGSYFSDEKKLTNVGAFNLTLAREYFKLSSSNENGKILYTLNPLSGPVQVGDTLAVRLTVTGSDWKYLMIEDPIPAGTEFITKDNLYTLKEQPRWWGWRYTRREFHDDRAAFFQTYFSRGGQEYVYLLKVVNPGVFRVSPGKVEPMYQPNYFATSDPLTLEVK